MIWGNGQALATLRASPFLLLECRFGNYDRKRLVSIVFLIYSAAIAESNILGEDCSGVPFCHSYPLSREEEILAGT